MLQEMPVMSSGGGVGFPDFRKGDNSDDTSWRSIATSAKPRYIQWLLTDSANSGYFQLFCIDVGNNTANRSKWTAGGGFTDWESYNTILSSIRNVSATGFEYAGQLTRTSHNLFYVWY